jgi:predicted ATPase
VIASASFRDFRVLENARLTLGPFNLLLGPNGSGKTTAVRALLALADASRAAAAGSPPPVYADLAGATAVFEMGGSLAECAATLRFDREGRAVVAFCEPQGARERVAAWLDGIRGFVLDPSVLAQAVPLETPSVLRPNGAGLAAVLAALCHREPDRWSQLVAEFRRIVPEAADVVAGQTVEGTWSFSVTSARGQTMPASTLSQGSLTVLALLTIAFGLQRPSLLCVEEIERGIHPRLLRDVRDILYRLSFPADAGDRAPPVQVLATTHSPYVLDLFVDTPEDVILAEKREGAASFRRLADLPELREMLQNGRLGDLWYSGILGDVL